MRLLAIAALVAFNAAMMTLWFVEPASRDALVAGVWIPGDAVLCLVALGAIEHWQSRHPGH